METTRQDALMAMRLVIDVEIENCNREGGRTFMMLEDLWAFKGAVLDILAVADDVVEARSPEAEKKRERDYYRGISDLDAIHLSPE